MMQSTQAMQNILFLANQLLLDVIHIIPLEILIRILHLRFASLLRH